MTGLGGLYGPEIGLKKGYAAPTFTAMLYKTVSVER